MAQTVGRNTALPFHDRSTGSGRVVSGTARPDFIPGKDWVHILQEAGWVLGPVSKGQKVSSPLGFDLGPSNLWLSRYTDSATRPTHSRIQLFLYRTKTNSTKSHNKCKQRIKFNLIKSDSKWLLKHLCKNIQILSQKISTFNRTLQITKPNITVIIFMV